MSVKKKSYRELKVELDTVLATMQDPDTGLDELLKLHDRANVLMKDLEVYLADVKQRLKPDKE